MIHGRYRALAGLSAMVVAGISLAQAPAKPSRIRGEIVTVTADSLVVHRRGGAPDDIVTIALAPDQSVSAVKALRLQDLTRGAYVGATSRPDANGRLVASEVHVIPESSRGSGEGHYPWDASTGSTMTNANVDLVVDGSNGRDLQLSYKGGNRTIVVPEGTPIVSGIPASRTDLIVGRRVFLAASPGPNGTLLTPRIVVEKDGVAPPY